MVRRPIAVLLAVAVAVAVAGGCGGGGGDPLASTTGVTSRATVDPADEAARGYLIVATRANRKLKPLRRELEATIGTDRVDRASALLRSIAVVTEQFRDEVARLPVPVDLEDELAEVVRASGREADATDLLADDIFNTGWAADFRRARADRESAVAILRARLGLPAPVAP